VHLIGVKWSGFNPSLLTDKGQIQLKVGLKLNYRKGKRFCIGTKDKPCPKRSEATGIQCAECRKKDKFNECVKCTGLDCKGSKDSREFCYNNKFYTYLVNFGDIVKVGVCYHKRAQERWIEQGADNGKIIYEGNGKEARLFETKLKKKYKDKVYIKEKVAELMKNKNPIGGVNLRKNYPGIKNLAKFKNKKLGELNGVVLCIKGPLLILDKGWVNLNEMIGYEFHEE